LEDELRKKEALWIQRNEEWKQKENMWQHKEKWWQTKEHDMEEKEKERTETERKWIETISGLEMEVEQLRAELVIKEKEHTRLIKKIDDVQAALREANVKNSENLKKTLEEERHRQTVERSKDRQQITNLKKSLKEILKFLENPNQPAPNILKNHAPKKVKKPALIQTKRARNSIVPEEEKQENDQQALMATPMEVAQTNNNEDL